SVNRPKIDLYETDEGFKLTVDLPGVEKEDIELGIKDNTLNLSAKVNMTEEEGKPYFNERKATKYQRMVPLPCSVEADEIEAKLENGLLSVYIPKTTPSTNKSITIE
ncbi:small heat shock protein, partial [Pilobolus umbonatus]